MKVRLRLTAVVPALAIAAAMILTPGPISAEEPWVVYEGTSGPGTGKHIVLVSGDEEYRSEEAMPQLGKILARRHGFRCTVLFAIDPETKMIDPNHVRNIPGLETLESADLMMIFTRFRDLSDDQMRHINRYLKAGKPVVGLRTATHAFAPDIRGTWAHYGDGYSGDRTEWTGGFGRLVLGEKWISHHGRHRRESTRGILVADEKGHPILRGLSDGDIWAPSDVYGVRLPLPGDSRPLVFGQVIQNTNEYDAEDTYYGLRPDDGSPREGPKNDPMMPVAWTKSYQLPGGGRGQVFMTTLGASTDLMSEGTRRMIVNGVYWALGLADSIPADGTNVEIVGEYLPTKYEFRKDEYWTERKMKVSEHRWD